MAQLIERIAASEQVSLETIMYHLLMMTEEKMRLKSREFIADSLAMKVSALTMLIEDHGCPNTPEGVLTAISMEQDEGKRFTNECLPLAEAVQMRIDTYMEDTPETFFDEVNVDTFTADLCEFIALNNYNGQEEYDEAAVVTTKWMKRLLLNTLDDVELAANQANAAVSGLTL